MATNWAEAPDWAQWHCMNRYRQRYWCENEPAAGEFSYVFIGRVQIASNIDDPLVLFEKWQETKEKRPEGA